MKKLFALLALFVAPIASGQQRTPSDYLRFLLPVLTAPVPGANGAIWETRLALRNDGPRSLDAFPLQPDCAFASSCLRLREYPAFNPGQDGFRMRGGLPAELGLLVNGSPGVFLYVERSAVNQFSAHLEVLDSSRTPSIATTLPVVREDEFFQGRHSVSAVPITIANRTTIRIYQLDPNAAAEVAVRVYGYGPHLESTGLFGPGKLLAQAVLSFGYDTRDACPQPIVCPSVPYHPGYVQISDLLAAMPGITSDASITNKIRIEFEPLNPNELYWPMVTVTDNGTNIVQVFTVR